MSVKSESEGLKKQSDIVRIGLLIDLASAAPVIIVAVLSNSLAMLTDVFDYAHSILANLISWLILARLARGRMRFSDYGPGKLESLGGALVSGIMLGGLAILVMTSLHRFVYPEPVDPFFARIGVGIHAAGLIINVWLWRKTLLLAREMRSHIMESQWRKNGLNALGNIGVILCLLGSLLFGGRQWTLFLDPAFALLLAVITGAAFIDVIRSALADILDRTISEEAQLKVMRRLAENYDHYDNFHGVRSRRVGARTFIEIMLGFDSDRRIGDALDVEGRLREALEQDIPGADVRVAIRPVDDYRDGFSVRSEVEITPLAERMMPQVMNMIKTTFPSDDPERVRQEMEESIWPGRHAAALAERKIIRPRYWAAVQDDMVVGVTGLYFKSDDKDAVWGGWTASSSASRASISRVKMLLLRKVAFECHNTGRPYFRLDTSNHPNEAQANRLYDRVGLEIYHSEPCGEWTSFCRQIKTTDLIKVIKLGKK